MSVSGYLTIKPLCAKLIHDTESFGKMDPYCKVTLGDKVQKTKVANDAGKFPNWEDQFTFKLSTEKTVLIEVWDYDQSTQDELIGTGDIETTSIVNQDQQELWIPLMHQKQNAGEIKLIITFQAAQIDDQVVPGPDFQRNPLSNSPQSDLNPKYPSSHPGFDPTDPPVYNPSQERLENDPSLVEENRGVPSYIPENPHFQPNPSNLPKQEILDYSKEPENNLSRKEIKPNAVPDYSHPGASPDIRVSGQYPGTTGNTPPNVYPPTQNYPDFSHETRPHGDPSFNPPGSKPKNLCPEGCSDSLKNPEYPGTYPPSHQPSPAYPGSNNPPAGYPGHSGEFQGGQYSSNPPSSNPNPNYGSSAYPQTGYPYPGSDSTSYPQTGYPQTGYPQTGYPQTGYPQTGYPPAGYPPASYPPTGYPSTGYPPTGYPPTGYPPAGYPPTGYPPTGYPPTGYPPTGYPPTGYPPTGYPPTGYPPTGYPPTGYPPGSYPAYTGAGYYSGHHGHH